MSMQKVQTAFRAMRSVPDLRKLFFSLSRGKQWLDAEQVRNFLRHTQGERDLTREQCHALITRFNTVVGKRGLLKGWNLGAHNVRHNAQITVNAITGSFRGLPQEWVEYMEAEKVAADGGLRSKFGFLLRQGGFGWRWRMRWFELRGSVLTCKREQLSPDADGSTHEYFLGGATISTSRGDDAQQQGAGA